MSSTSVLVTTLKGYAGLQSLIGDGASPLVMRVYPMKMPDNATRPSVVYHVVAGERMNTLSDSGGTGVERFLIQVTAWADTQLAAQNVIEQVRLALKADAISYVPQSYTEVYESGTKLYGVRRDFSQWYR